MDSENWLASTTPSRPPPSSAYAAARTPQQQPQAQQNQDELFKSSQSSMMKFGPDFGQAGKKTEDVAGSPTGLGNSSGSAGRFGKTSLYGMIPDAYDPSTPTHPRSRKLGNSINKSTYLPSSSTRSRLPLPSFSSPEVPRSRTTTGQSEGGAGQGEEEDAPVGGRGFVDVWGGKRAAGNGLEVGGGASGSGQMNNTPPQPSSSPQPAHSTLSTPPSQSPILRIVGPPRSELPNFERSLSQSGQLDFFRLGPPDTNWCEVRYKDPVVGLRLKRKNGEMIGGWACGVWEVKEGQGLGDGRGDSPAGGMAQSQSSGNNQVQQGQPQLQPTRSSTLIPTATLLQPSQSSGTFRPSTPVKKAEGKDADKEFGMGLGAVQKQDQQQQQGPGSGWTSWLGEMVFGK